MERLEEVKKTAVEIASKGKVSLRAVKQTVNSGVNVDLMSGCGIDEKEMASDVILTVRPIAIVD